LAPEPAFSFAPISERRLSAADEAMVRRLVAGDAEAFDDVVSKYHTSMVRLARSFVRNEDVAQEVAQETWMAILKGISRFQGRSSLKNWMFRILTNRAKTRGTRERRMTPLSAMTADDGESAVDPDRFDSRGVWDDPPQPWQQSPEKKVLRGEIHTKILAAIQLLPARQRQVVVLRDLEHSSAEDVCEVLGISDSNQRVLLHRGRSKVRATLEAYLSRGTAC